MKIAFYTLGCKVNQYETQSLRERFAQRGWTVVSDRDDFDVMVINSCTVTGESDRKTRQQLNHFKKLHPDAAIVLTGCMVQAFAEKAQELDAADIVVGNGNIGQIPELVDRFFATRERIVSISPHVREENFDTPRISAFAERTRAYMKIEDGCDRFCTYCIIPYARGFVRSRPLEEIRREAERLAQNGYQEIVLVGINLSSYGKGEGLDLCDAVEAVCKAEDIRRVRLGSLEPDTISDEMLHRLALQQKFCPQFHLSLQSGCDETLRRMNRHYDTAFYTDLVTRIRAVFPTAAVTTDVMVGFAGETEEEFAQSLAYIGQIGFAKCHVFAYSRRAGTLADGFPGQIANREKADRSHRMIHAAARAEKAFLDAQVGSVQEVLFETNLAGVAEGFTPNYTRVAVKTDEELHGKLRKVRITAAFGESCEGELL